MSRQLFRGVGLLPHLAAALRLPVWRFALGGGSRPHCDPRRRL